MGREDDRQRNDAASTLSMAVLHLSVSFRLSRRTIKNPIRRIYAIKLNQYVSILHEID